MLHGDLSLVDEMLRRHAQVAGTAVEGFLLAGSVGGYALKPGAEANVSCSCENCSKQVGDSIVLCGAARVSNDQVCAVHQAEGIGAKGERL